MTGVTVRYTVAFGARTAVSANEPGQGPVRTGSAPTAPGPARPRAAGNSGPSRAARMLALAYHVEDLVERGVLRGYAEAARALGITRARMTQVMNLLLLPPEIQEGILTGAIRASERRLRARTRRACWRLQTTAECA